MSRIDDFEEMLDGYEGREYNNPEILLESVSRDARKVYDSLPSELQKKVLSYLNCVKRTGLIKWSDGTNFSTTSSKFFDHYLRVYCNNLSFENLSNELDKKLQLYKKEEK